MSVCTIHQDILYFIGTSCNTSGRPVIVGTSCSNTTCVHVRTLLLQVEGKTLPEVTEFYYYWKKYCNDEYRGRNRHISEEVRIYDILTA